MIITLIGIDKCRHSASTSKLGTPNQTIIGHPRRHNNDLRICTANLSISIIQYFEVRPYLLGYIIGMRHKLDAQPHKLLNKIKGLPSAIDLFQLLIRLVMFKSKELFFIPHKSKRLDIIVYLFRHGLSIDFEFKDPTVFQAYQHLVLVLLVCVFMQFLDLTQRKMDQTVHHLYVNLVITQNKEDADVVTR